MPISTTIRRRPGPAAALALLAIRGYQRWLSPLKGFRCAHAVLHGGPGCSGYAASAIHAHGLIGALGAIRQRFRDCRAAYEVLKSEQSGEDAGEGSRTDKPGLVGAACSSGGAPCSGSSIPGLSACGIGGAEGAGTACSACNLGGISCCG
jgi:putative component of membrane protein insertase Oxa1/YidC/SpoIIIJ protein YidD